MSAAVEEERADADYVVGVERPNDVVGGSDRVDMLDVDRGVGDRVRAFCGMSLNVLCVEEGEAGGIGFVYQVYCAVGEFGEGVEARLEFFFIAFDLQLCRRGEGGGFYRFDEDAARCFVGFCEEAERALVDFREDTTVEKVLD